MGITRCYKTCYNSLFTFITQNGQMAAILDYGYNNIAYGAYAIHKNDSKYRLSMALEEVCALLKITQVLKV